MDFGSCTTERAGRIASQVLSPHIAAGICYTTGGGRLNWPSVSLVKARKLVNSVRHGIRTVGKTKDIVACRALHDEQSSSKDGRCKWSGEQLTVNWVEEECTKTGGTSRANSRVSTVKPRTSRERRLHLESANDDAADILRDSCDGTCGLLVFLTRNSFMLHAEGHARCE